MWEVVRALHLDGYFDGHVISSVIDYDKPRKEIFEYAYTLAGRPEVCFMIGDSPVADIQGARSFGMPSILVHSEADCGAGYCFADLSGIADVI